jgi:predicted dehydrogenase
MAKRSHTVGIVGLGYGRAHIPAFQAHGCRVIALCQRNAEAARPLAERYGVPEVHARWEDLLERSRPDIVVIAAPPALHRPVALAALAAGAHVLCEKPLAMDAAEGREMVEAAARAGRVAMTGFNWRFTAALQRFNALVGAGHLGRVLHVRAHWFGARWADAAAAPTWRMDRTLAGAGALGDMGVHLVDMVRWNFGEFVRLVASAGVAHPQRTVPDGSRPGDTEDYCTIAGELASGARVTLEVSRAARGRNDHGLEAYGERGALVYRVDRDRPRWWRGELWATRDGGPLAPVKAPALVPRRAGEGDAMEVIGKATIAPLVKRFLAAIRAGGAATPSLEDGRRAQLVLDAALASQQRGAWVEVARD